MSAAVPMFVRAYCNWYIYFTYIDQTRVLHTLEETIKKGIAASCISEKQRVRLAGREPNYRPCPAP